MAVVSMKQLLEAGVHFGHQTRRWNPKMAKYIFTERNGIYIIDLQKTVKKLDEAYNFVRDVAADGGEILFVGTKKQAQESIRDEATRCGMHYVNARWLGGMMTNFRTIRKRIDRMEQLKTMQEDGTFDLLPKKEVVKLELEMAKLDKYLGGVKNMNGCIYLLRSHRIQRISSKTVNSFCRERHQPSLFQYLSASGKCRMVDSICRHGYNFCFHFNPAFYYFFSIL